MHEAEEALTASDVQPGMNKMSCGNRTRMVIGTKLALYFPSVRPEGQLKFTKFYKQLTAMLQSQVDLQININFYI